VGAFLGEKKGQKGKNKSKNVNFLRLKKKKNIIIIKMNILDIF